MKSGWIKIPSEADCIELAAGMGMLDHIMAHCRQVCRVSLLIADHLKPNSLNRDLVQAAALLHDITKTRSLQTREDHAKTGDQLLSSIGYPELGRIVGQHVRLESYTVSSIPTEAQIVNYADKRVLHDRIVPLQDRMAYILDRYGREPSWNEAILLLWKNTEKLEERLFERLPFAPQDIKHLLAENAPRNRR